MPTGVGPVTGAGTTGRRGTPPLLPPLNPVDHYHTNKTIMSAIYFCKDIQEARLK
jgi:hypothetical protein